jgi:hypothetical protein
MTANNSDFLANYPTRPELAKMWGVSAHTILRYEHMENGLPHLLLGGRKRYPLKDAIAWLESRIRRPNPTRAGA